MADPRHHPERHEYMVFLSPYQITKDNHRPTDIVLTMPRFIYRGDRELLVTTVRDSVIGLTAIRATFGNQSGDPRGSRPVKHGVGEFAYVHSRMLDGFGKLTDDPIQHIDGRLLGSGYVPHVIHPSDGIDYDQQVLFNRVSVAHILDAKSAFEVVEVAELRS